MDIDLDFPDRDAALRVLTYIKASRKTNTGLVPHNTGVYAQLIPSDVRDNLSTIDYKTAASRGYFKIDFLNASVYEGITSEEHLITLMNTEPIWGLLLEEEFSNMLFHISGYHSLLIKVQPKSVLELAAFLAMLRPAKKYLIGKSWDEIYREVWLKPASDEYYFKKAHAISYAIAIVVQMNLICETTNARALKIE